MISGFQLGAFTLSHVIGRGATAEVWAGRHRVRGTEVAVKLMTDAVARTARFLQAFRHEIRAMAALDHPHVSSIYDHGLLEKGGVESFQPGSPYLVMALADGGSLKPRIGKLTWPEIRTVLEQTLAALAHAHARGLIHRDLKPGNILLTEANGSEPHIRLADFGLAHALDRDGESFEEGQIAGSPHYMAPEQFRGDWRDFGPWTDLYGLGCLAFQLLDGKPPYEGRTLHALAMAHMESRRRPLVPAVAVPPLVEAWISRLLEPEIHLRFSSCAEAAHVLRLIETNPDAVSLDSLLAERRAASRYTGCLQGIQAEPPAERAVRTGSERLEVGTSLFELETTPVVGREEEKQALWWDLWVTFREAETRAVLLDGPMGTGKSKLAAWLIERATEEGVAHIMTAVNVNRAERTGAGLRAMVTRFFHCWALGAEAAEARIRAKLPRNLDRSFVEPLAPWLANEELLSPIQRFERIHQVFTCLAHERPIVCLLEDAQWSLDSLALAQFLLEKSDLPLLLVLTVGSDSIEPGSAHEQLISEIAALPTTRTLPVEPLDEASAEDLIRGLLPLDEALTVRIAKRTAGNPLFAVQLLGDWVRRRILRPGPTGYRLRAGESEELPPSLNQVWRDRVDAVFEDQVEVARDWLEIAAALGQSITTEEWHEACRLATGAEPVGLLDRLLDNRLALEEEGGWSFVHGMLRESIQSGARERGRWQRHNAVCAETLLPRFRAGRRGIAARLGLYYMASEQPQAALEPLLAGARELRETSDYQDASDLLDERDKALPALAPDHPARGESWNLRARICLHQGRIREAREWASRTEQAGNEHGWTSLTLEAERLQGDAARRGGDLDSAISLYRKCIDLEGGGDTHAAAACLWGLGDIARMRDQIDAARDFFERSRKLYENIGDEHGIADYQIAQGDIARQLGQWVRADQAYRLAEGHFDRLGNQYGIARALNSRGDIARHRGDLQSAERFFHRSREILHVLRSAEAVFPELNLALVAQAHGDHTDAAARLDHLLEETRTYGWELFHAFVTLARATTARALGDHVRATELAQKAHAVFETRGVTDPDLG